MQLRVDAVYMSSVLSYANALCGYRLAAGAFSTRLVLIDSAEVGCEKSCSNEAVPTNRERHRMKLNIMLRLTALRREQKRGRHRDFTPTEPRKERDGTFVLLHTEARTSLFAPYSDADAIDHQISHKLDPLCSHAARNERGLNPFVVDQEQRDGFGARHSPAGISEYRIPQSSAEVDRVDQSRQGEGLRPSRSRKSPSAAACRKVPEELMALALARLDTKRPLCLASLAWEDGE